MDEDEILYVNWKQPPQLTEEYMNVVCLTDAKNETVMSGVWVFTRIKKYNQKVRGVRMHMNQSVKYRKKIE